MKNLFLFCCVLISVSGFTQNLVPDPGFEITSEDCEPYPGLVHWYSPTLGTPDLYRYSEGDCGYVLNEDQSEEFQFPETVEGDKMAGIYCCMAQTGSLQTREYLSTLLVSELEINQVYRVSIYVHRTLIYNLAVDKIGVLFSNNVVIFDVFEMIPLIPQLESNEGLLDSEEPWIHLEWDYLAQGGESVLTIGCFRDYDEMEVVDTNSSWKNLGNGYYLIDNVSVQADSSNHLTEIGSTPIISQREHIIDIQLEEAVQIDLFNSSGNLLDSKYNVHGFTRFFLEQKSKGLYLISFRFADGRVMTRKIIH